MSSFKRTLPISNAGQIKVMNRKRKILGIFIGFYGLLLAVVTVTTIIDFTQRNFAILFTVITIWPIGRFFLLRHPVISAWLNRQEH